LVPYELNTFVEGNLITTNKSKYQLERFSIQTQTRSVQN